MSMLQFYQSNSMAMLTDIFCERGQLVDADPFVPSNVIVQSYGTGQWLKLQLASRQGISANIECVLPAHFIWELYRKLLNQPQQSPLSVELLTWRLMTILKTEDSPQFDAIDRYLGGPGDTDLRRYQLADKIAGLFDQYLMYRPEWLLAWEEGRDPIIDDPHPWQKQLWLTLMETFPELVDQHRAKLHQRALHSINQPDAQNLLPERISLFGLSSLPQIQLDTFRALSTRMDVDIYFLNPCQHYWGDIVSDKNLAKRSVRQLIGKSGPLLEEDYLEVGNPLLASMGAQGREFLELILETENINPIDAFVEPVAQTALGIIQKDILNLEYAGDWGRSITPSIIALDPGDTSIQIHSAHSKPREIEILLDQLLANFERNPELKPSDVIVMMPNVTDYAPFIHATFRNRLPYGIADRSFSEQSSLVASFLKLLDLPDSRLTSAEVMDFLETPAVARRFEFGENELSTISYWIREAGIRWEMSGESKSKRWQVPETNQNTWRFGLDRLLLGLAMDSAEGTFGSDLPFDVNAGDGELLGTLAYIVQLLDSYRDRLSKPHSAVEWQSIINDLLADMYLPDVNESLELSVIQSLLQDFVDDTITTEFSETLSGALFRYWMNQQLNDNQSSVGFISGGVTFATLIPMRSIPFKMVCLLGMNDRDYPREGRTPSFDLMKLDGSRKGDRSRRSDDRYLFLEALLSTEEVFYISYEGRSIKDNQIRPPSVVVGELIDYLNQVFDVTNITEHPLQPFSRRYFENSGLVTYQKHWYDALTTETNSEQFMDGKILSPEDFNFDSIQQLVNFFRHSGKYFLQHGLGVYFNEEDFDLNESESFELDNLERYQVADEALQAMVRGDDLTRWRQEMLASGFVMDSPIGLGYLESEQARAETIYLELQKHLTDVTESYTGQLELAEHSVQGQLNNLVDSSAVYYRCGALKKSHLLEIWINHLFANASGLEIESISISKGKLKAKVGHLKPVNQSEALQHLNELANLFTGSVRQPLCFPPETAFSYVESMQEVTSIEDAKAIAEGQWDKGGFPESNDPYWSRLFSIPRDLDSKFVESAHLILDPLLYHWEESQ
jgi:exodeoxyribonuclease V gamma subunit